MADSTQAPNPTPIAPGAATAPVPGSTSPVPSVEVTPGTSPSTAAPPEDWKSKYESLENEYKPWKELDGVLPETNPRAVRESLEWAKRVAAEIQAGRLIAPPAPKAPEGPATDPYDGWDDLSPREQAARMRQIVAEELRGEVSREAAQLKEQLGGFTVAQQQQLQLGIQALRLQQQNPGVSFEAAMAEATRLASLTPQQLLNHAFENMSAPEKSKAAQEAAFQQRLAEEKAKWENERAEQVASRPSVRLFSDATKSPIERRNETEGKIHAFLRGLERKTA